MTARARITQADMERAVKSVKAAGFERARIIMDLGQGTIEIIIGEHAESSPSRNPWDDESAPAHEDWRKRQPLYGGKG